ncbi:HNH endonuclease family protein [Nocardiopsis sp. EMB25]|uniref:HNH endonuclease family protein n=1 Tax=Nocardiopsis sp. EMB25 TaxID=2835867 RepID=UPI002283D1F3|nr:HNH endonuclease family protein [Nocardiopsis sp. EMB25]MCY9784357.1 HNH endonuclease family protein [Nocardiopsis sp. EMB25]
MRLALAVTSAAVLLTTVLTPATAHAAQEVPLTDAIAALTVATESRDGYDRSLFPHWVDGDRDGCHTRKEVLIDEATTFPEVGPRCRVTGGEWESYYDGQTIDASRALDVDHMVPLAEAWDSGASDWTTARRRDYANDLDEKVALVAVSARSNRSKADQDPSTWLPPLAEAHCRYVTEWVTVKTRWGLSVDERERDTLTEVAATCPDALVHTRPAP